MFSKRTVGFLVVLIALVACTTAPTFAATGQYHFEGYFGYYTPGLATLDNDWTFGARFGGRPADMWGWEVEVGRFDLNGDQDRPLQGTVGDANADLIDFSFQWFPGGGNFIVFGGPGFVHANVDIVGTTKDESDDAFSFHAGVGYIWNITDTLYIRPDIRWREVNGDSYDDTDMETSVALGWKF